MEANAWPGHDTIIVPRGTYALSIAGNGGDYEGDFDITESVDIISYSGAEIDGAGIDRIFDVWSQARVFMSGLFLKNGDPGPYQDGGAIRNYGTLYLEGGWITDSTANRGGAIYNSWGYLELNETTIARNTAEVAGGGLANAITMSTGMGMFIRDTYILDNEVLSMTGEGGGIWNQGYLQVGNTLIDGNDGSASGGGIRNGSNWSNPCDMEIRNSTISNNTARVGAGLSSGNPNTTAQLDQVSVSSNTAEVAGGGLYVGGRSRTSITRSVIDGNQTLGMLQTMFQGGAGIYASGGSTRVEIENVTIAQNVEFGAGGGAVHLWRGPQGNQMDFIIHNSAIVENRAAVETGGIFEDYGVYSVMGAVILMENSGGVGAPPNCDGSFYSDGNNLLGDLNGCGLATIGTDLSAGPFSSELQPFVGSWAGPGSGHYPLATNSQALGVIPSAAAPADDQLGNFRSWPSTDIGPVEY